jgi:hypothetical protein
MHADEAPPLGSLASNSSIFSFLIYPSGAAPEAASLGAGALGPC